MSTLRNKTLVKNLQARLNMENSETSSLHLTGQNAKIISEQKLKKITKAFVILKEKNRRMSECLNTTLETYRQEYDARLQKLYVSLKRKTMKLEKLRRRKEINGNGGGGGGGGGTSSNVNKVLLSSSLPLRQMSTTTATLQTSASSVAVSTTTNTLENINNFASAAVISSTTASATAATTLSSTILFEPKRYFVIIRQGNNFVFTSNIVNIEFTDFKVIVYKLSQDPKVDQFVCMSIAKKKYNADVLKNTTIVFANHLDNANLFEQDLKEMFQ
uniref:Uncharacterized protein n=1 Tax=Ectropis obliqua nucleopolyhedrovirus TaxID=59376 RepID=S5THV2_9ABAC|nr:hypothetical protein wdlz-06GM5 [Ectropis obliqua nucleopolyhedrovirus]QWV59709.1 hypothetical protein EONV_gp121 [Ectropis obliqua nucleopolyhedrovirus]UYO72917.1 hypothetical protein EONV-gp121 [Ectropis obliqua nucleopolyhedrovirus]